MITLENSGLISGGHAVRTLRRPGQRIRVHNGAPDDYLFARPTSDETIYEWENPNVDRSKNTALIPPTFGSPDQLSPRIGNAFDAQSGARRSGRRPGYADGACELS